MNHNKHPFDQKSFPQRAEEDWFMDHISTGELQLELLNNLTKFNINYLKQLKSVSHGMMNLSIELDQLVVPFCSPGFPLSPLQQKKCGSLTRPQTLHKLNGHTRNATIY